MSSRSSRQVLTPLLVAGAASSLLLALSMTPAFSSVAAAAGGLVSEAGGGQVLAMRGSSAEGEVLCGGLDGVMACSSVDLYGGRADLVPGEPVSTEVVIENSGTIDAAGFVLTGGECTQQANGAHSGDAADLCARFHLVISSGVSTVFEGSPAELSGRSIDLLAALGAAVIPPGASVPFRFQIELDSKAGNSYQGLRLNQPLTWTFTQ